MNPVAVTGLMVAAVRAEETARAERWFEDPFAAALAGDVGREALRKYREASPPPHVPVIEVRTRYYDEAIARAVASGIRQIVILAAGMDSRAYRLAWPEGTRLFEIDQASVMHYKSEVLGPAVPRCERTAIACDLLQDWPTALKNAGFSAARRTLWLVEGLLQYLPAEAGALLLSRLDRLSAQESVVVFDVLGLSMLQSAVAASTMRLFEELGAPWIFGTDDPASLLPSWRCAVTEPAIIGTAWKRWPYRVAPPGMPGIPRTYLIEASKS